ncbi:TPA: hypothetical protein O9509_001324 [Staphylococcus aureus]|nr:hypothetical protein [Staphylococcus aureus]HDD0464790.1 hypothetical protein [Staphylococcus aureus]HDD0467454.1 hypothetical protein [Staphylococcus aureus]
MTKEKMRLTYRLNKKMYIRLLEEAEKRNISVNAEINRILYEHYFGTDKKKI